MPLANVSNYITISDDAMFVVKYFDRTDLLIQIYYDCQVQFTSVVGNSLITDLEGRIAWTHHNHRSVSTPLT
jgi:hypothetical protein